VKFKTKIKRGKGVYEQRVITSPTDRDQRAKWQVDRHIIHSALSAGLSTTGDVSMPEPDKWKWTIGLIVHVNGSLGHW